jgi:hypothetical protein
VSRPTIVKSAVLIAGVFVVVLIVGSVISSGPSDATVAQAKPPTTVTTTEPPPEGVAIVRLSNGVFRPANLKLDPAEIPVVQWVNEDPREYVLVSLEGAFESPPLGQGDTFEFDYSTLEPGIHRYNALIGAQRVPGSVDTRPDQ